MVTYPLVLGSSSPYRKMLLKRLGLPFKTDEPAINETPANGELPDQLVRRLAIAKARAVSIRHPDSLIIGCDQVGIVDGQIIGKPGTHDAAVAQLRDVSGKTISLLTGLCLLNSHNGNFQDVIVPFMVKFKRLSEEVIERYLVREKPYDCTGSVRVEGLGIALLESLKGDDPNALIGLPLIKLVGMLKNEGVRVL